MTSHKIFTQQRPIFPVLADTYWAGFLTPETTVILFTLGLSYLLFNKMHLMYENYIADYKNFQEHQLKAVATFMPRRNNTTLAIFMPMVTYSMHVYILKMVVSPLCIGAVFISFSELEMRLVCCA